MLNTDYDIYHIFKYCKAHGQHLNVKCLNKKINCTNFLRSASTHSLEQIHAAEVAKVDFITLSPVLPTATHPNTKPLGWLMFEKLCASTFLPVYALGGMNRLTLYKAKKHGACGIAAIRAFWSI